MDVTFIVESLAFSLMTQRPRVGPGQPRYGQGMNVDRNNARQNYNSASYRLLDDQGEIHSAINQATNKARDQSPTETNAKYFQPHSGFQSYTHSHFTASSDLHSEPKPLSIETEKAGDQADLHKFPLQDIYDDKTPNIVVFGESGVGKSSVINLIAGEERAPISNGALGCTFQYRKHTVMLSGVRCALWDTTGLDEGTEGTVPARIAENNLQTLMRKLVHSGGIHLVMYCIRGTRLTKALRSNYDLFYVMVCRRKVPVALVVTGLEHEPEDMETWWGKNVEALTRNGMQFDAHECVTTLNVDDAAIRQRRADSQRRLRELVVAHARRSPWRIEPSLMASVSPSFRNLLRGMSNVGSKRTTRKVMVYDETMQCGTRTSQIDDRRIEYEHVEALSPYRPIGAHAGALVFYTTALPDSATGTPPEDDAALRTFYDMAGGQTRPLIVVLRGCASDHIARQCWDVAAVRHGDIQAYTVADVPARLDALIEQVYIEPVDETKLSRLWRACMAVVQFCGDRLVQALVGR